MAINKTLLPFYRWKTKECITFDGYIIKKIILFKQIFIVMSAYKLNFTIRLPYSLKGMDFFFYGKFSKLDVK